MPVPLVRNRPRVSEKERKSETENCMYLHNIFSPIVRLQNAHMRECFDCISLRTIAFIRISFLYIYIFFAVSICLVLLFRSFRLVSCSRSSFFGRKNMYALFVRNYFLCIFCFSFFVHLLRFFSCFSDYLVLHFLIVSLRFFDFISHFVLFVIRCNNNGCSLMAENAVFILFARNGEINVKRKIKIKKCERDQMLLPILKSMILKMATTKRDRDWWPTRKNRSKWRRVSVVLPLIDTQYEMFKIYLCCK